MRKKLPPHNRKRSESRQTDSERSIIGAEQKGRSKSRSESKSSSEDESKTEEGFVTDKEDKEKSKTPFDMSWLNKWRS